MTNVKAIDPLIKQEGPFQPKSYTQALPGQTWAILPIRYSLSDNPPYESQTNLNGLFSDKIQIHTGTFPLSEQEGARTSFKTLKESLKMQHLRKYASSDQIPLSGYLQGKNLTSVSSPKDIHEGISSHQLEKNSPEEKWENIFTDDFYEKIDKYLDEQGFRCIDPLEEILSRKKFPVLEISSNMMNEKDLYESQLKVQNIDERKLKKCSPFLVNKTIHNSALLRRRGSHSQGRQRHLRNVQPFNFGTGNKLKSSSHCRNNQFRSNISHPILGKHSHDSRDVDLKLVRKSSEYIEKPHHSFSPIKAYQKYRSFPILESPSKLQCKRDQLTRYLHRDKKLFSTLNKSQFQKLNDFNQIPPSP